MSKNQRLVVLAFLLVVLAFLFLFEPTSPNVQPRISAILFSALFLLSFAALLLEHFFTRPTDVLAAAVSILLLLIPSGFLLESWGTWYWVFFSYEFLLLVLATGALVLLTDGEGPGSRRNRLSAALKGFVVHIGPGRVQYFFLFLLTLLFFVESRSAPFVCLALYSGLVLIVQPQKHLLRFPKTLRHRPQEVGEIFGVQGVNTFLVRLHGNANRPPISDSDLLEFSYGMDEPGRVRRGMILERFYLDQAQWIRVLCHQEIEKRSSGLQDLTSHRRDAVYRRKGANVKEYLGSLVGVVHEGSDVGSIRFLQAGGAEVEEGSLVETTVGGKKIIYQVTNGRVDSEHLESKNEADFIVGEGSQLGEYDSERGTFERFGWVPRARTPLTKAQALEQPLPSGSEVSLGCLPSTEFPVLMDRDTAISHHTAILGVTGVGKSVFARNLVRRLLHDDLRVVVVDFTREWSGCLADLNATVIIDPNATAPLFQAIDTIAVEKSKFRSQQDANVIDQAKRTLYDGFHAAIVSFLQGQDRVGVFELPDVSNTEGVLEYTQWFFKTLFRVARDDRNFGKQVCVVLEEAHTVVPEWNFIGLADRSSQSLVNNIGQIALQGRKYGIGFIVIAQRTASVSKTVLTQCNTIIAFQCFDGTSIDFLSHYLPKSVADTLPNLRFRQAVAFGKAIRGSVPLIFEVPEMSDAGTLSTNQGD